MTATPDDGPRWEVVPNFRDRTGIPTYRAPAADSPEPRVLEGHGQPPYVHVAPAMMGIPLSGFVFSVLGHTIVSAGVALAVLGSVIIAGRLLTARRRGWKVPRLVTNVEGLSVTDVTGHVRDVAWADFRSPSLRWLKVGPDKVVQLQWTDPAGLPISLNLGDTMDLVEVRRAIVTGAPENMELQGDPGRAADRDTRGA